MTAGETFAAGPGTLQFGETGTEIDISCQVNSMTLTPTKDQGEAKTMLCGTTRVPQAKYTFALVGNFDLDLSDPAGLWQLTVVAPGSQVPFTYTPSTAADVAASGTVQLDPVPFGYEEYGEIINADIEWLLTAGPEYTRAGAPIVPVP
jgi:hypothetical protein